MAIFVPINGLFRLVSQYFLLRPSGWAFSSQRLECLLYASS